MKTNYLKLLKQYDEYTYNHSVNVYKLCLKFGNYLNLSNKEKKNLSLCGLFHDIGKLDISLKILNKQNELTKDEFNKIKMHPVFGYEILSKNYSLNDDIKFGVLFHHENEDGSGYPLSIKYEQINKYAKIVHIIDVYDALISKRSYKPAFKKDEILVYMEKNKNILFDCFYLEEFLKFININ